jgi:exopolyphosphatase/pppGpp-phosphohydrolase
MTTHPSPLDPANLWQQFLKLALTCAVDLPHAQQVQTLSLMLFDQLQELHRMSAEERLFLQCAAIAHDIGIIEGEKSHHKTTLRIILKSPLLTLTNKDRLLIGSIARYHRRALPHISHDHFVVLNPEERRTVKTLAGLLRIADALDYSHHSIVGSISCKVTRNKIKIHCSTGSLSDHLGEENAVKEKKDLCELVFKRSVSLIWVPSALKTETLQDVVPTIGKDQHFQDLSNAAPQKESPYGQF